MIIDKDTDSEQSSSEEEEEEVEEEEEEEEVEDEDEDEEEEKVSERNNGKAAKEESLEPKKKGKTPICISLKKVCKVTF